MSLSARVTALAQSVGADIKALALALAGMAPPGLGDVRVGLFPPDSKWLPANGGIYAQADYSALFASLGLIGAESGYSFRAATNPTTANMRAVVGSSGGVWRAVGTAGTLIRSVDGGATWIALLSGFGTAQLNCIARDSSDNLIIGADGGVARRSAGGDGGAWSLITAGMGSNGIFGIACSGTTWVMSGLSGALSRSTDSGVSFVAVASRTTQELYAVASDDNGTWVSGGAALCRSVNNGQTWTVISPPSTQTIFALDTDGAGLWITAGEAGQAMRSLDNGATWSIHDIGFGSARIQGITTDRKGTWVAVGTTIARRSTDNGKTWSTITGLVGQTIVGSDLDTGWVSTGSGNATINYSYNAFPYDSATQFKLPNVPVPEGIKAYIKVLP